MENNKEKKQLNETQGIILFIVLALVLLGISVLFEWWLITLN